MWKGLSFGSPDGRNVFYLPVMERRPVFGENFFSRLTTSSRGSSGTSGAIYTLVDGSLPSSIGGDLLFVHSGDFVLWFFSVSRVIILATNYTVGDSSTTFIVLEYFTARAGVLGYHGIVLLFLSWRG